MYMSSIYRLNQQKQYDLLMRKRNISNSFYNVPNLNNFYNKQQETLEKKFIQKNINNSSEKILNNKKKFHSECIKQFMDIVNCNKSVAFDVLEKSEWNINNALNNYLNNQVKINVQNSVNNTMIKKNISMDIKYL